jgi:autotransporter-associated beta strand protein
MNERKLFLLLFAAVLALAMQPCAGGSATWANNPITGDWNTAANWIPNTIPNGPGDVATFAASNVTDVTTSAIVAVDSIVFDADAAPFGIVTSVGTSLTISGTGIINNSPTVQTFRLNVTDETGSALFFLGAATAGESVLFNNFGSYVSFHDDSSAGRATFTVTKVGVRQGNLIFWDNATAAYATIATNGNAFAIFYDDATAGNAVFAANDGGTVVFSTNSRAEQATIQCSGGTQSGRGGGGVDFDSNATAAQSYIVINGAAVAGAVGNDIVMSDSATGGTATFVVNGGAQAGAEGAAMSFFETSNAGNAGITVNGGTGGGEGGALFFNGQSDGGTARVALFGNGQLNISGHGRRLITIGSLAGDGLVFLGTRAMAVGSNNLSTTFSGVIQDTGSLTKTGTGTLTLNNASTYTGATTVSAGTLIASNISGSATGTGSVSVNAGTLGGKGIISGAVTLGTGSGTGAFLAPAAGSTTQATLTIQSALTFKADAIYAYTFRAQRNRATTDKVIANGVTINSGAMIALSGQTQGRLSTGLTLTLISNTSANPISGTFANLPDGAVVTINRNHFQASYSGGDGNDLTLTVVP